MGSLSQFRRNSAKDRDGVWVGKGLFDPNPDGTTPEFKIRPAHKNNNEFQIAQAAWRRKHPRMLRSRKVDLTAESEKMLKHAFGEACLVKWRNFKDDEEHEILFDKKAVHEYLRDFHDLYETLYELAAEAGTFLEEEVEDMKGE